MKPAPPATTSLMPRQRSCQFRFTHRLTVSTSIARDSTKCSEDPDLRVVADHEAERARLAGPAADRDVAPEQRGLHPPVEVRHGAPVEQDRVLDLGPLDGAVLADRRVRADVA